MLSSVTCPKKKKMKKSPFELRVDLIPFWVCRQLGITYWVQSHPQKKKKKNPLLNYVLTWSPFGYVGSLVSFTEFSHILKKKKSPSELRIDLIPFQVRRQLGIIYWVQSHPKKKNLILNYVLTCSPFKYAGSLVFYAKFSHMSKKNKNKKLFWTMWWLNLS